METCRFGVYVNKITMETKEFKSLLEAVKQYSDDARVVSQGFATGTIYGYKFRLFQEKEGAYLCIRHGEVKDGMWPAYYSEGDIHRFAESLDDTLN